MAIKNYEAKITSPPVNLILFTPTEVKIFSIFCIYSKN